jgi:predicted transcriptional regulator of viral defense system
VSKPGRGDTLGRRAGSTLDTAQAAEAGVSPQQLSHLARTGSLERVAKGIYPLRRFPAQRIEDVIVACLWAGDDAVASHDTGPRLYKQD